MNLPRFYPIVDTGAAERAGVDPLDAARQIIEAGARILQFRHKGFLSRSVWRLIEAMARVTHEAGSTFVVNDRADLAVLTGSALHLGQDDLAPADARRVTGPGMIVGYSTHNETQLRAAAGEPVNYVALGPMFGTASKENPDPMVGVAELKRLRPLSSRPLVAIGGINRSNAGHVIEAGADSVAIIGDLFEPGIDIRRRAEEWLRLLR